MFHQSWNVLGAFPQGRNVDAAAHARQHVAAHLAGFHQALGVTIGGKYELDRHRTRRTAANTGFKWFAFQWIE